MQDCEIEGRVDNANPTGPQRRVTLIKHKYVHRAVLVPIYPFLSMLSSYLLRYYTPAGVCTLPALYAALATLIEF